jgi:uncharacterized membrane protein YoaK (UPF0700 family)
VSTPSIQRKERETAWVALVLAWVAGYVNVVAYFQLSKADVSHMTGDTMKLGPDLVTGKLGQLAVLLTPIPIFVLGIIIGIAVIQLARNKGARSPLALILGLEAALLSTYIGYATAQTLGNTIRAEFWWQITLLISLPTVAMAFQTALIQKVAGRRIRTTYITGMLSDLAEDVVGLVVWFRRHTKGHSRRRFILALRVVPRQRTSVRVLLLAAIWTCFFLGALCGAYAEQRVLAVALVAPVVALVLLAIVELVHPTTRPERTPTGPS